MATAALMCQTVVERVTDYLERALPAEDRARVDEHLAECPNCLISVEQMRHTIGALGRQIDGAISLKTRERLLQRLRAWAERRPERVRDREEA